MNGTVVSWKADHRVEHLFSMRTALLKALRMAGDTHTIGDIGDGIMRGAYQYWYRDGAGIVTEIIAYPQKRVVNYFLAFGDLETVLSLQPEIEAFARENGCSAATLMGRPGWQRVLPADGWRPYGAVMVKDLV